MVGKIHAEANAVGAPDEAQPIKGGIAPTIAPAIVLLQESCFRGVYMQAYSAILESASVAGTGPHCDRKMNNPHAPVNKP